MTPVEIQASARNRYNAIGDPFYSNDFINEAIYEAQVEMCNEGLVIERKYDTTSVAGTREYSYPTNAFSIRRVEYKGEKVCPIYLERDPKTSNTEPQGTPREYAIWNEEIILFPTPDTDGDTITVYTYNRPQAVTNSSTLEVPIEYQAMIVNFVVSHMASKDGNEQKATYYMNLFNISLERAKRHNKKKKNKDEFFIVRDQDEMTVRPGLVY